MEYLVLLKTLYNRKYFNRDTQALPHKNINSSKEQEEFFEEEDINAVQLDTQGKPK
jgi:hypothetical protein